MYRKTASGDECIIEPIEIPKGTAEVLREIMLQNRLILEENCRAMRLINSPYSLRNVGDKEIP